MSFGFGTFFILLAVCACVAVPAIIGIALIKRQRNRERTIILLRLNYLQRSICALEYLTMDREEFNLGFKRGLEIAADIVSGKSVNVTLISSDGSQRVNVRYVPPEVEPFVVSCAESLVM